MARPKSRFCVYIVILLLDKMLFGHAEQSEFLIISLTHMETSTLLVKGYKF